jgi:hypothetical protein
LLWQPFSQPPDQNESGQRTETYRLSAAFFAHFAAEQQLAESVFRASKENSASSPKHFRKPF